MGIQAKNFFDKRKTWWNVIIARNKESLQL